MAVKIVCIKRETGAPIENSEAAHATIQSFGWVQEQTQRTGTTSRENMYDWLVNKKGRAYIIDPAGGETIYVFGRVSASGNKVVMAAKGGNWTSDLLTLPEC